MGLLDGPTGECQSPAPAFAGVTAFCLVAYDTPNFSVLIASKFWMPPPTRLVV